MFNGSTWQASSTASSSNSNDVATATSEASTYEGLMFLMNKSGQIPMGKEITVMKPVLERVPAWNVFSIVELLPNWVNAG